MIRKRQPYKNGCRLYISWLKDKFIYSQKMQQNSTDITKYTPLYRDNVYFDHFRKNHE